jgi:HEAT repeat protein
MYRATLLLIIVLICVSPCLGLLSFISTAADTSDIIRRLQNPDVKIRRAAANELMKAPSSSEDVIKALGHIVETDTDDQVKYLSLEALGRIGPSAKGAIPAVIIALGSKNKEIRQSAAWSIGKMGHEGGAAASALIGILADPDKDVRRTAAWALAITGAEPKVATPALVEALADSDIAARQTAARALGLRGIDLNVAIGPLIKSLNDSNPEVRKLSAIALASFATRLKESNSIDSIESLRSIQIVLEKHPDSEVRDQSPTVSRAIDQLVKLQSSTPPTTGKSRRDVVVILGVVASIVVIVSFIYFLIWGQHSVPEVLRKRRAEAQQVVEKTNPKPWSNLLVTPKRLTALAYDETATKFACGGFAQVVDIFDAQSQKTATIASHQGIIRDLLWVPGENAVVSTGDDGLIQITDSLTHEFSPIGRHEGPVYALALLNGPSKTVVSGGKDGTVRLWDLTEAPIHQKGTQPRHRSVPRTVLDHNGACVFGVDTHRSGKWIAVGTVGGGVYIWEVAKHLKISLKGNTGTCFSIRFCPNSETLAACGADNTIKLWLLAGEDKKPRVFSGHLDAVRSIDFHPSGRFLLSASKDRTLRIWDCSSGQSWVLEGHTDYVYRALFHPDGMHCLSVSGDGSMKLWQIPQQVLSLMMRGTAASSAHK